MTTDTITDNRESFDYGKSLKKGSGSFIDRIAVVERYINRPLASLIVRAIYKTAITPNGLTYFSFLVGLVGAYFISRGTYQDFVLGGILTQLSAIIDCADGQLARAKDMCSKFGSYLDLFLDRITDFALILGASVGCYRYWDDTNLLMLGLLGSGLYLLQINLYYITKNYKDDHKHGATGEARAMFLLLVLVFSIAGRLDIMIYLLLVETAVVNAIRIIHFISLGRKNNQG